MQKQYEFLRRSRLCRSQFDELVADERVAKIREAFFQYFLNTMAEPAPPSQPAAAAEQEKQQVAQHPVR